MASKARPGPTQRRKLLAIALAFPAGLLLAELIVRVCDLGPAPRPEFSGEVLVPSSDPLIGFENRPGGTLVMHLPAHRGSGEADVVATVNAQGFRGPEVALEKPAGTLRVACIGDSHTFGHGVGEGESWPDRLRELLPAKAGAARVEVMNCGVNAHNTLQEVSFLGKRVMPYAPDLVLLQYHLNDASARESGVEEEEDPGLLVRWTMPHRGGAVAALRKVSAFADMAFDWVYRRARLAVQAERHRAAYAEESAGWKQVCEALAVAAGRLRSQGVPFAVLLYPYLVRSDGSYLSHAAFEQVKAACAELGVPCLDPEQAFLRVADEELHVDPQDVHGNARANRILAEETAAWLEQTGLLAHALERVR